MKYLFFDIESANSSNNINKICEFGYTLVDEDFNLVLEENILINPRAKFEEYVIKNLLSYNKEQYLNSPDYTKVYDKIKALFTSDTLVFGHSIDNDARYLNDENKRYKLPFFDYEFYDIKYLYKEYTGAKDGMNLKKIACEIGAETQLHEHRALDDAICTKNILKKICEKEGLNPLELVKKYSLCKGYTKNGVIDTANNELIKQRKLEKEKNSNKMTNDRKTIFINYSKNIELNNKIMQNSLTGKKLCISINYESKHYKEMLAIVKLLANFGARYVLSATKCDYFVRFDVVKKDGNVKRCTRLEYVKDAIRKGKNIKIITFDMLLSMLNVTEDELLKMALPKEVTSINL